MACISSSSVSTSPSNFMRRRKMSFKMCALIVAGTSLPVTFGAATCAVIMPSRPTFIAASNGCKPVSSCCSFSAQHRQLLVPVGVDRAVPGEVLGDRGDVRVLLAADEVGARSRRPAAG